MTQVKGRSERKKGRDKKKEGKREKNDENQNLHETNMILTENLLNSVELSDKLLLQLHYEVELLAQQKSVSLIRLLMIEKKGRQHEAGIFLLCVIVCNTFVFCF